MKGDETLEFQSGEYVGSSFVDYDAMQSCRRFEEHNASTLYAKRSIKIHCHWTLHYGSWMQSPF